MTLVYGLATLLGALGLVAAVVMSLRADRPRLPASWRSGLLGVTGFGLAGMSASFGGWPSAAAFGAALAGGAVLVFLGARYASEEEG